MDTASMAERARSARVVETHVSVVVFIGDRVYKLKKPVKTGFLDFSTRESRERVCHREVELNRRLAPDVYLGVADVICPDGELCDHLVVMRRMPDNRRLSSLLVRGESIDNELRAVARVVAAFHSRAETSAEIAAAGTADGVRRNWCDNLAEIERFVGPVLDAGVVDRVRRLAEEFVGGRESLFRARVDAGCVRDGHGDLLADDVFCLDDGPRVLDCIEFDDRLRYGDVLADVAFLVMDLERLGSSEAASTFLAAYRELSGETAPASLLHHYVAYRALVRSKVACLRGEQGDARANEDARRLLALCHEHLERGRVFVVLVGGPPGTGKSTLAGALSDDLGWVVLRSDEIRKDLAGLGHTERTGAAYRAGLYGEATTNATYEELLRRARELLELGESVILDASWTDARWRDRVREIAAGSASDAVELRCELPPELASTRIARRSEVGGDPSDATAAIARAMRADTDPWPSAAVIDTSRTVAEALDAARAALDAHTP